MKNLKNEMQKYFLPYQVAWLEDRAQIKIWEKSRRIGATYTQAYEDVRDIVKRTEYTKGRPVTKVYFASKDEDAGKEYIEYCVKYAKVFEMIAKDVGEQVIDEKDGVKARVLEFANGGKIYALTSAPTAFNSKGGKIVWDEAALHKDQRQMWSGAQPAAMVWGYPIRILSTHKGKSTLFYQFCQNTKKGKSGWSLHRVTIVDAVNDGLYDKVLGRPTCELERAEYIGNIKKSCQSDDIFAEDYMAEPVDATTAFITYDQIALIKADNILRSLEELASTGNPLYAGWDIGRKRDLSVIFLLEDVGSLLLTRLIQKFDRTPFSIQKEFLHRIMKLLKLRRICIDQTGMGLPLTEEAQEKYGKGMVEGITFTNANKETLAVNTRNLIEDRGVMIPDDQELENSIHSIKRIVTTAGNIRYDAQRTEETGHADEFWALALAIHAKTGGHSGPVRVSSGGQRFGGFNKFCDAINYDHY
ncbi:MAG: terminase family protein [Chitinispirillia bacterium]|nr:terminase family protein [Chitinispirillia bacterium]